MTQRQAKGRGSAYAVFEDGSRIDVDYRRQNNTMTANIRYDHDANPRTPALAITYRDGNAEWIGENGRPVSLPASVADEALRAVQSTTAIRDEDRLVNELRRVALFATDPIHNRTPWAR